MEILLKLVAILSPFLFILSLVWLILHYRDRRRSEVKQPATAISADLEVRAEKMEQRIDALEQILDAEAPGWRKRHHEH